MNGNKTKRRRVVSRNKKRSGSSSQNNDGGGHSSFQQQQQQQQQQKRTSAVEKWQCSLFGSSVSYNTLQASGILVMAIVASVAFNFLSKDFVDARTEGFLERICADSAVYCHHALIPSGRTQRSNLNIPPKSKVLEIPRRLQIWDLDALRDPFVRELFPARRSIVLGERSLKVPASTSAFLAAHLAWLQKRIRGKVSSSEIGIDPILEDYLINTLPTSEEYQSHPFFWDKGELETLLGNYTSSYQSVTAFQELIPGEYAAFSAVSSKFAEEISLLDYATARLSVMTRSFGTGPTHKLSTEDEVPISADAHLRTDELDSLRKSPGVDLSRGSHAMVPVLDLYDHHANSNVDYQYNVEKQAFVISSSGQNGGIKGGSVIMDSYGKHTDSHMFAKYGFVNGDGSGHTEASLALWHRHTLIDEHYGTIKNLMDQQKHDKPDEYQQKLLKRLRYEMLHYLRFDDGYEECIEQVQTPAWELKSLKYKHLLKISNVKRRWIVYMQPRNKDAALPVTVSITQPVTTRVPPKSTQMQVQMDIKEVLATCRLLSLTHDDYGGRATKILEEHLSRGSFPILPPATSTRSDNLEGDDGRGLEFRTHMCVVRLASAALDRFNITKTKLTKEVGNLNYLVSKEESGDFGQLVKNWTAAYLRLGEMETLEVIKAMAHAKLQQLFVDQPNKDKLLNSETKYIMRQKPCSLEALMPLFYD